MDGSPVKKIFQSQNMKEVGLRFVSDSGVCKTTPGVHCKNDRQRGLSVKTRARKTPIFYLIPTDCRLLILQGVAQYNGSYRNEVSKATSRT
jgi:hypothetical protein